MVTTLVVHLSQYRYYLLKQSGPSLLVPCPSGTDAGWLEKAWQGREARTLGTGDPSSDVTSESSGRGRRGFLSRLTWNRKEGRGEEQICSLSLCCRENKVY